ncbi:hypothetical protein NitYY0826_C1299 [Nitratiruptor sp. YY08-26]|uniref:hypothetical protein n=1 Tax=unclassified Nitratiruptor TaxID=2624044 RepID=UPI0019164488|nr:MULTISPECIES: hypothetical protein [unclassified Nitratiruptor]BCD62423.1 hypothetical protein NitYY0813_C1297 [Nitratiruptor sp. YY08-13]BCD66359.1 hypothetical protein NitYY0826_C1299 [Nitratiruptor sp. YY08-26]
MLIITATYTEAAPIIEALQLEKVATKPFRIYAASHIQLLITGIGMLNAAIATASLLTNDQKKAVFNIGYAAADNVGILYNITKVIDGCSKSIYHLSQSNTLPNAACTTLCHPATTPHKTLVDMEASAIVRCARVYNIPVKILKIGSDRFNPKSFQKNNNLIRKHIDTILSQIELQLQKNIQGKV